MTSLCEGIFFKKFKNVIILLSTSLSLSGIRTFKRGPTWGLSVRRRLSFPRSRPRPVLCWCQHDAVSTADGPRVSKRVARNPSRLFFQSGLILTAHSLFPVKRTVVHASFQSTSSGVRATFVVCVYTENKQRLEVAGYVWSGTSSQRGHLHH